MQRPCLIAVWCDQGKPEQGRELLAPVYGWFLEGFDTLDLKEAVPRTSGVREADNRLSGISAMLTWAIDRGHISANPLRGFNRLYHADRSEIIWLPEHIAQFMKVAPVEIQRALILGVHLGQREGDLLRLPWSAYDGVRISLRQGKARRGGKLGPLVEIPCTAALRRMLDGMDRIFPLILTTKTGQSLKSATSIGFGKRRRKKPA